MYVIGQQPQSQPEQQSGNGSEPSRQPQQPVVNPFAALFGGNVSTAMPGRRQQQQPQQASFEDQLRNILHQGASYIFEYFIYVKKPTW